MHVRAHFLVVILSVICCVPALAAPRFLGWEASGATWFQTVDGAGGAVVQICREDTNDVPNGWPEGLNIGPGAACADLPAKVGAVSAADFAKKSLKGQSTDRKNAFGLELKMESKDGKSTLWVIDGAEHKDTVGQLEGKGAVKLGDVQWRKDGKAVAVVVLPESGKEPATILVVGVAKMLTGGPAGHRLAERLATSAQGLMKKRDWSAAGRTFEDAIAADGSYAPARFGRAAAEAQGGVGRSAMIENLSWLKEHSDKDKDAKRLLEQARHDAAFDAWVGEPEVRELLGLPKVSAMDVPSRLLERTATWSVQGSTCKSPWLTLSFKGDAKKGGAVNLVVADSCKGKKSSKSASGTWKQSAAGPFEIELKKLPDGVTFPLKASIVLDESYQQLKLQPAGGDAVGTFEPGGARIDDSTL